MPDWTVETWLGTDAIDQVEYAEYWNDEAVEADKQWNVAGGDFEPMERYLAETGLIADLEAALAALGRPLQGTGADLAAGTLWATPHLLAAGAEHVVCVEFSRHRLAGLGPKVLEHYGVEPEAVTLALGSFYELKLDDASLNFVFMSQALHHADAPDALLAEVRRVLRPGGAALIIGEHVLGPGHYLRGATRTAVARGMPRSLQQRLLGRVLVPARNPLVLPPDPTTGDHYYSPREYRRMFARAGLEARPVRRPGSPIQGFVALKPD